MNGATLKTVREALGLPVSWLAGLAGVQERTVRYWEANTSPVPDDVREQMLRLETLSTAMVNQAISQVEQMVSELGQPSVPIHLVRYASDADLGHFQPDMAGLPVTYHAATLARIRWALSEKDIQVIMSTLDAAAYTAWLRSTRQRDSAALRSQFVSQGD